MTKVRHITYGTPNYTRRIGQLRKSAARFGVRTYAYTPHHPTVKELQRQQPGIMSQQRGAGYWLWKPAIILDALANAEDGTIVMYSDAAMRMIADPAPMLAYALDHPVMLFEHTFPMPTGPIQYPMAQWTKRDAFILLGADVPECHRQQQLWAGLQIYRNGSEARDFVREVLAATSDARVLTDQANNEGSDNLPGFREHRHDQSVLSIIAWRHGIPHFPDPTQFGLRGPRAQLDPAIDGVHRPNAEYGQIFEHHRRPDRGALRPLISRLFPLRNRAWSHCEVELELRTRTGTPA